MRVCVPFVGDSVGGSHVSALLLLRNLDRISVEVVLHRSGPLQAYLERHDIACTVVPCNRLIGESRTPAGHISDAIHAIPILLNHLRRSRPDCVYTNDLRMHLSWAAAAQIHGTPHLWHQRTRWADSRLVNLCAWRTRTFVAISNFCASTFPGRLRDRIVLVRDPIYFEVEDRSTAKQELLDEVGAYAGTRLIGFVGNLLEQKRPRVFLEAARIVAKSAPWDCRFILFGASRSEELALHSLAQSMLPGRIHFLGFRDPISRAMAGLDVLVAPGIDDAFGRTVAEAMMLGTPVVASASGGHMETVEHEVSGLLFPPDNPEAAAAAILSVLHQPERTSVMSERAREIIMERFSLERHTTTMQAILANTSSKNAA